MQSPNRKRDVLKLYTPPPQENNANNYKRLTIVISISLVFVATQIVAGIIAHSISIISDAIHLICDVIGYFSSFLFLYLAKKPPTPVMTFGYHRMELLGALSNIFIVWTLIIFVMIESTHRIINKEFVEKPLIMLIAAAADLFVNLSIYKVLHEGPGHSHGLLGGHCHGHGHGHHHHDHHHHHHEHEQSEISQNSSDHNSKDNQNSPHSHSHSNPSNNPEKQLNIISMQQSRNRKRLENEQQISINHHHSDKQLQSNSSSSLIQSPGKSSSYSEKSSSSSGCSDHSDKEGEKSLHEKLLPAKDKKKISAEEGKKSIGMQAAVLHALSDLIMSVGLIISSLIIFFLGNPNGYTEDVTQWNAWHLFDPIATYVFSITALISTLPVIRNSYSLLMESAPSYIQIDSLRDEFEDLQGVIGIKNFHVWQMKPGKILLMAQAVAEKGWRTSVLIGLSDIAREKKIYHTAIQVEEEDNQRHLQNQFAIQ